MYFTTLLVAVAGSVTYHLSLKRLPDTLNPFFSLAVIYSLALLISLAGMALYPTGSRSLGQLNWSLLGAALGVIGIEVGFLLAYRAGWSVGYTALSANVLTTLMLLPLGYLLYREQPTLARLGGMLLCSSGMWLLLRR
ncbi:hypothetical protein [Vogesella alkaliphila]|uniref:Membrane protein n=1 Tax=Vogesella alkaliphila TaxID=1193621 RepID=A0ABQ2YMR4_9NEIS|nr:hypothetical protein [Vogesella alkaliphila]GGX88902.1 membrane protein [Vogesella alkaliphila]